MNRALLLLPLLFLVVVVGVRADTTTLSVSSCTIASCSVPNYNTNTTSIGATVGKGTSDTTGWDNLGAASTINSVVLRFRHSGATGISGSWTMTFQSVGGATTYCTYTSLAHTTSDQYVHITPTGCSWTKSRVDDLEIVFTSGDGAGPTDAYIYFAQLYVDYNAANNVPYNTSVLQSNVSSGIVYGQSINLSMNATDPETDNWRLTVCKTNAINDGYPGTCATDQTVCTSAATSSGSYANCTNITNSAMTNPLTVYGFMCDAGSTTCNTTSSSLQLTFNRPPAWNGDLGDTPDPVTSGNQITYTANGTDPEADNYRLTVCRTNTINNGYPGTCEASQELCTSSATTSGVNTSCSYTTTGADEGDPAATSGWSIGNETLVSYYGFEDYFNDSMGRNAAANQGTTNVSSIIGGSAREILRDDRDWINTSGVGPNISGMNNYTINFWINFSTVASSGTFTLLRTQEGGSGVEGPDILLQHTTTITGGCPGSATWCINFDYIDGSTTSSSGGDIVEGQMHMITWVYYNTSSAGPNITGYVDGVYVNTTTGISPIPNDIDCVHFGDACDGPGITYNGSMDEIGVWQSALNATQVLELYNRGVGCTFGEVNNNSCNSTGTAGGVTAYGFLCDSASGTCNSTSMTATTVVNAGVANPCAITCDTETSANLDCSGKQLNITGSGRWLVKHQVVAASISKANACMIVGEIGNGKLLVEAG